MKTVLIVEDEDVVRSCMARVFKSKGLNVITVATGEEALDIYSQNNPDYLILDFHLPGINGLEILKKIRNIDKKAQVYFISGDQDCVSEDEKKDLNVLGCIVKPIDAGQLFELADNFIAE